MQLVSVSKEGSVILPMQITKSIKEGMKFIVIKNNENILLKPIKIPDVTELAKKVKDKKPMTLEKISEEIHKYRKAKKQFK